MTSINEVEPETKGNFKKGARSQVLIELLALMAINLRQGKSQMTVFKSTGRL